MTLIKTSFWTGLSVFIKAFVTFATSKIIALYTGPVGLALIEQFQNFVQIIRTFSGSLIQFGVIKYVAEHKENEVVKSRILSSAAIFCIVVSVLLGCLLIIYSTEIAQIILQSPYYANAIKIFAISIILFSLNSFFLAILNGEQEIKKLVSCNIANTIISFLLTTYLIIYYGIYGGFIALVCNQSIVFFFTLFLLLRCQWFSLRTFFKGIDLDSLSKLITYAFITIISTLVVPLSQIIVRNYVAQSFSWEEAGYWQGMMKLSNNYFILVYSTLGVYYLPKLAGIQLVSELKKEIFSCYRFLLPLAILVTCILFIFRKQIVIIFFSTQFLPMLFMFKYQLIGDVARIGAWILSYIMIAKKLVKPLIVTEMSFLFFYPTTTIIFTHYYGLIGTAMGFAVSYLLYWMIMSSFILRYFRKIS